MAVKLEEIARRLGADISPRHAGMVVERLLTDSRSLSNPQGTLFFALHTHTGDGHFYLQSLYARGVRMFVVERIPDQMRGLDDAVMLTVADTLPALQKIGIPQSGFDGKRIAVCGSRGKTIVKEWLYNALETLGLPDGNKSVVVRSPRSFNSQTGVPLSLWQVPADADYAVIETGISRPGEMDRLRVLVKPDMAIFTGIDVSTHAEGFDSIERKAMEKAIMAHGTTAVFNADCTLMADAIGRNHPAREVCWSRKDINADLYIEYEQEHDTFTEVKIRTGEESQVLRLPFTAAADVEDAMAVLTALIALGYGAGSLPEAMESIRPIRTRMDVVEGVNGCTVAVDGYEADMSSMPEALDFMQRHSARGQKLTLIVSPLRGAGAEEYRMLGRMARERGVERIIAVGPDMRRHAASLGERTEIYDSADGLLASLSVADFSGEFVMVKGTCGDGLDSVAEMLAARKHETVLEVNLGALARNYASYRRRLPEGTRITAMVKASAYGMGGYEVARTLQDAGAAYLAVAVLDEGLELRRRGITMPVMVMNPKAVNYRSMFANRLEPEIYSASMLDDVIAEARRNGVTGYPVHIKLDTGMHRTGFETGDLDSLCSMLVSQNQVEVASVFSHLATADCLDMDEYTLGQVATFVRMTEYMSGRLPKPFLRHILNSAGIVRFPEYGFDMARLGIGLYGVNTLPPPVDNPLEPVARLRTVIITLRRVAPGEAVGYGRMGPVARPSLIATLPIGYADGFNRHFGRGAVRVLVRGKEAPTIGNVCMDQCMIDVTGIDCAVGDEVEIFGTGLSIERLAGILGTIPYEVLTSISPRVKRLYYRE